MKSPENAELKNDEVAPGPHTRAELQKIREDFGPGADIALKSIYKSIGYKVTSHRRRNHTESDDQ